MNTVISSRPYLAIISNEQTPYRIHFHRRIVREIPELELVSFFTHEVASSPWPYEDVAEINPILIGAGERSADQSRLSSVPREWAKGGQIIRWLSQRNIGAVVVLGYNDAGRLRIIHWCKQHKIPCFLFGDSNVLGDKTQGWRRLLKNAMVPPILRSCSGVFCCGELGRQYFQRYGVPTDSIHFMPYEPDYDEVRHVSEESIRATRSTYGLSGNRRHMLFVGRLLPVKRPDLLLEAFQQIAHDYPDWDLLFAGDGSLRDALVSSVKPELRARVRWTGFIGNRTTLNSLYAASDLFVLPSDYEPWGVVVNEAAVHLPIIASDSVGAGHELIVPDVNGQHFASRSCADLTRALRRALEHDRATAWKRNSRAVLADWRRKADPIQGLRRALSGCVHGLDPMRPSTCETQQRR